MSWFSCDAVTLRVWRVEVGVSASSCLRRCSCASNCRLWSSRICMRASRRPLCWRSSRASASTSWCGCCSGCCSADPLYNPRKNILLWKRAQWAEACGPCFKYPCPRGPPIGFAKNLAILWKNLLCKFQWNFQSVKTQISSIDKGKFESISDCVRKLRFFKRKKNGK